MKTFFKIAGALAAAVLVLLGAAAAAVRVLLPPEKMKALAISGAGKALHRTLEVRSVELGLLSGLRIQGLRLSEAPDFSKGEFLKAESFTLSPEWLPLLRRRIVARKLELRGASVAVVEGADGKFNFSDLLGGAPAAEAKNPAAPAAAGVAAAALDVGSIRLQDVTLRYADVRQGVQADVELKRVDLDGFGLSGPFSLAVDAQAHYAAAGKRYAGTFKAKGKASLGGGDGSRASLDLASFSAKYAGQTLEKTAGRIFFTRDSVDAPELTGLLDGGAFRLKIAASKSGPAADPALKTSGDLAVDKIARPNFECGKAALAWNLSGITPDMKRLAGTARLRVAAGKAVGILGLAEARGGTARAMLAPLEALQKARALRIPGVNLPDLQSIPFDRIAGDYSAARGVVSMQPFLLDSPAAGMSTTGTVDLGAQTANLKTVLKSPIGEVDLAITGPFSSLSVRPSAVQLQDLGRKLLQNQGKALLDRLLHGR